ncbi:unnamed protein product [Sphagnum balticum]
MFMLRVKRDILKTESSLWRSLMQQSHVANLLMTCVWNKEEQQQQHRRRKKISRDPRRVLPPLPALVSN